LEREKRLAHQQKLMQELAQQIEEVKVRKAAELKREQEEEEKYAKELVQLQQKQLKLLEEEK
jgi:phosphoribosylformylglycinamidine (FGAM) synthase PurS component